MVLIKHIFVWFNLVFNLKFTVLALDSEVNLLLSLQDESTLMMMLIKMKINNKDMKTKMGLLMLIYLAELVGGG